LPPTFINHMINEALEFYQDLDKIKHRSNINLVEENILLHKIWLPDASGHAAAIAGDLDPTETIFIEEANNYKALFDNLFIKVIELGQVLDRTNLKDGNLHFFNEQVEEKINNFIIFLEKIKKLRIECKLLGVFNPLMADHMIREEYYYLVNIKSFLGRRQKKEVLTS
jgi:hypothetical protein